MSIKTEGSLIGYIPIECFQSGKPKICESPRHMGLGIPAYAVLVIKGADYPDGLVQMICRDCWNHFDQDMGSPKWNLIENDKGVKNAD